MRNLSPPSGFSSGKAETAFQIYITPKREISFLYEHTFSIWGGESSALFSRLNLRKISIGIRIE